MLFGMHCFNQIRFTTSHLTTYLLCIFTCPSASERRDLDRCPVQFSPVQLSRHALNLNDAQDTRIRCLMQRTYFQSSLSTTSYGTSRNLKRSWNHTTSTTKRNQQSTQQSQMDDEMCSSSNPNPLTTLPNVAPLFWLLLPSVVSATTLTKLPHKHTLHALGYPLPARGAYCVEV